MNDYSIDDLKIGKSEEFDISITKAMLDAFASVTGDVNPMHLDDHYAKSHGFDGRLAYGMLTASFYSTLAGVYLPGRRCLLQSCNASFSKPVYVGDRLTVRGKVTNVDERFSRIEIKACVLRGDTVVSRAKLTTSVLKDDEE